MTVSVPGYAKINLFLDIRSIRDDGYHNILSIMQRIDLHDTVTVSYSPNKNKSISLTCDKPEIPCDAKNLAYKAADLFPICGNIGIHIEKRIPMSAGLAGGSADAAAVLRGVQLRGQNPRCQGGRKPLAGPPHVAVLLGSDGPLARGYGDLRRHR